MLEDLAAEWGCSELAHSAELKLTLTQLSQNWLKLAVEVERTHALLDEELAER